MSARDRGWGWPGAPGSAEARNYQRNLTTITLRCGVRLTVRREVAHLFVGFWNELEAETGYSLADRGAPDDWGYANRDIRGRPGVKSNHAWGLAVDGNAEENPMRDTLVTNMPVDAVRRIAARWGLRWGGDYQGRKDAMHVEFVGTPGDVRHYPLGQAPRPAAPAPVEDDLTPEQDARLAETWQRAKNLEAVADQWADEFAAVVARLDGIVERLDRIETA